MDIYQEKILIIDFGSQYTQLIARMVREFEVYCEVFPYQMPADEIKAFKPTGIILSGGPESVTAADAPQIDPCIYELGCPILGICYGMQLMAKQLGGQVSGDGHSEFGHALLRYQTDNPLFSNLPPMGDLLDQPELVDVNDAVNQLDVWMSHGDKVTQVPTGFRVIASSDNSPVAAMMDENRQFYGLQFHPEVTHTTKGDLLVLHFLQKICRCEGYWSVKNIIDDHIKQIRAQVGQEQVVLALSGGVDSSVVAALLHRAIGEQLTCIFVNNGLLRQQEVEQVEATFAKHMQLRLITVDAVDEFLTALQGIDEPEAKRKIIGNLFIDIFAREAKQLGDVQWLAQGTIYPDVIESAKAKYDTAHVIKSHHNVGGLPDVMPLKLIEPLRELFKDEVRRLGVELSLPKAMVYRHPFPGPGLAVRILGEVTAENTRILRLADAIFIELLHQYKYYDKTAQAFAVFLPVKAVGVVGDARRYGYVIALRAVTTVDFMTAHWARLPDDLLADASRRIINEIPEVARVVYDISSKPPATIEWE